MLQATAVGFATNVATKVTYNYIIFIKHVTSKIDEITPNGPISCCVTV